MQPQTPVHATTSISIEQLGIERLNIERAILTHGLLADLTRGGYASDWRLFTAWCGRMDRCPLPAAADTAALYLTYILTRGQRVSTAERHAAGIAHAHKREGLPSPVTSEVRAILSGAQRIRGEQPRQMIALSLADLRAISVALSGLGTAIAERNRAMLLVGFASALRRSSLCSLQLADVEFPPEGAILHIRREKQDQEGRGRLIGIPAGKYPETCAVAALRAWLDRRGGAAGPLFTHLRKGKENRRLTPQTVHHIVKGALGLIGVSSIQYGAHSLRAGFITAAGEAKAGELLIAAQTGHTHMSTLRRYFRRTDLFRSNACAALEL